MSLPDYILKQIKCCLSADDNHIQIDPVLLKCGGNACKECVNDSTKCLNCNSIHSKNDFTECKSTESLIRYFVKELFANLNDELRSTKDSLNGFYLFHFFFIVF